MLVIIISLLLVGAAAYTFYANPMLWKLIATGGKSYDDALRAVAAKGDAEAQAELGGELWVGDGVAKDQTEAVMWLRKSADQGNLQGLHDLGVCYNEGGGGLPQDQQEAARLWRLAAEKGFVDSQYNLGIAYRNGVGVKKNDEEAMKWLQKAADQGDEGARQALKN